MVIHNLAGTLFKIIFVIVFIEASNIISIPIYRQISRGYVPFDLIKIGPILRYCFKNYYVQQIIIIFFSDSFCDCCCMRHKNHNFDI